MRDYSVPVWLRNTLCPPKPPPPPTHPCPRVIDRMYKVSVHHILNRRKLSGDAAIMLSYSSLDISAEGHVGAVYHSTGATVWSFDFSWECPLIVRMVNVQECCCIKLVSVCLIVHEAFTMLVLPVEMVPFPVALEQR